MNQPSSIFAADLASGLATGAGLHVGRVQSVLSGKSVDVIVVAGPFGMVHARRAAGCLLMPRAGDSVLLFLPGATSGDTLGNDVAAYVLNVLERPDDTGELALPATATLAAQRLELRADTLSLSGKVLSQAFASVRSLAGHVLERAGRRMGLYGKRKDRVTDVAETTAGRIRVAADETLRLRARNADVRAQNSAILDAEHVKIG